MKKYPIFRNPKQYLETREPNRWRTRVKQKLEHCALKKCLHGLPLENGILDVPCGPGRLFPFWATLKVPVFGADMSEDFVAYARELHEKTGAAGWVAQGDAFQISELPELQKGPPPSVIASVRFIYYFTPNQRVKLLKSFAKVGSPYILTQYILKDTLRSRRKRLVSWILRNRLEDRKKQHLYKRRATSNQMEAELAQANIEIIRTVPAGPFSDRVYVIGKFKR